jgi:hypothetical protein
VFAKKIDKRVVGELISIVTSEDAWKSPHLECLGQDCSACISRFIGEEPMLHDEGRGVIKEGYQVNDASASCGVVWNMYLM